MFVRSEFLPVLIVLLGLAQAQTVVVNPTSNQNIVQPVGTQFSANNLAGLIYVAPIYQWSQSPSGSLSFGSNTVTLTPCPHGIFSFSSVNALQPYYVFTPSGTAEAMPVTSSTCTSGAASGTIVVTAANAHSAGYTLQSAYAGIQEAINDAGAAQVPNLKVIIPPTGPNTNAYRVYATVYDELQHSELDGTGAYILCYTRNACLQTGDLQSSNDVSNVKVTGIRFGSAVTGDNGCLITNTQRVLSGTTDTYTITVASGCPIRNGENIIVRHTDNTAYWNLWRHVTVSGTSISWTTLGTSGASIPSTVTPGDVQIENAMIEDNAATGTFDRIQATSTGGGNFNNGIIADNDQAMTISHFDNAGGALECTANACGAWVYSGASVNAPNSPNGNTGNAAVIWISQSNISPQCGGSGVEDISSNTVRVSDSVIQGFGMYGIYLTNTEGNYGGGTIDNVYMEEGGGCSTGNGPYSASGFETAGITYGGGNYPLFIKGGAGPQGICRSSSPPRQALRYTRITSWCMIQAQGAISIRFHSLSDTP
jgi:hypothetical protein